MFDTPCAKRLTKPQERSNGQPCILDGCTLDSTPSDDRPAELVLAHAP
eukprot:CAMPEP_0119393130 /NCGR_PEP_ID=MMETSP1334-20130426/124311_1 /TAXON_ID=127549 /ORGANISM="Calcidiscus leptoporus, Strain RCC1130" /LENGTH=47 /DNA_ID= /DNA_START= /DNA_END= /DNA_ORIENTATION=